MTPASSGKEQLIEKCHLGVGEMKFRKNNGTIPSPFMTIP
jgi:hypothetical protein